ncbi:MAG TPA: DUF2723 domain-containing protein [Rubrobacteraceae bacterium]|nr:DUF2723 domain-containing protein [Rubrobacteraceae bacterium]
MSGSWTDAPDSSASRFLAAAAIGAGTFFVYLSTLAPTIATNDAGRFQIAAPTLGTGHPTGYPTFILLGKLFTYLPLGDIAYRMNLMAAVFGAAASVLFFLASREIGGRPLAAAGGALLFAFSSTFWSQATVAEVYTMHATFVLGVLYLLLRWRRSGAAASLLGAALLYGVSLGNNAGMVLLAPAFAVLVLAGRWRKLTAALVGLAALECALGLSVYAYIPIRGFAGAWHNYGDPVHNWGDVWKLVTGARFQGLMGGSPAQLLQGSGRFLYGLATQAPPPIGYALGLILFVGGIFGARALYMRDKVVGVALILALTVTLLYAISYRIADIAVYYIPVYLFLGLFLTVWVTDIAGREGGRSALAAAPLCLAVLALAFNYGHADRSDYYAERQRSEAIMARLPERAVLYGKLPIVPVTYLREVEGVREDVTLRWLDGGTQGRHMYSDVESGRPVYVISDPRYNEIYLKSVRSYARTVDENGLIRLDPR